MLSTCKNPSSDLALWEKGQEGWGCEYQPSWKVFFFPMSAQGIPGEFSSRLHLRSQGADVRAGQWKDTGGWLAGQGPEGGVAPRKQVWKNQFPSKPAPGCESASCYATLEYFQTTWLTPEQWHFSVRVPERGIPLERVCVFVRSRTSACLSQY